MYIQWKRLIIGTNKNFSSCFGCYMYTTDYKHTLKIFFNFSELVISYWRKL